MLIVLYIKKNMKKLTSLILCLISSYFLSAQNVAITSTIAYNGVYATGDYTVFLAAGHTTIQKPIIITDIFDPDNYTNGYVMYQIFNTQASNYFATRLDLAGYDVITLNFDNGLDYIQRNAFLLVTLIQTINAQLVTNGSTEHCIVIGPSLGGLIARYALTYMEANGLNHNTSTFVSYDAPQKGANIPLGIQWFLGTFLSPPISGYPWLAVNNLNSHAVKQMLVYHRNSTTVGNVPNQSTEKTNFFNELYNLNGVGYPVNCKKIAVASGNKKGLAQVGSNGLSYYPGTLALTFTFSDGGLSQDGNISTMPSPNINYGSPQLLLSSHNSLLYGNLLQPINVASSQPVDNCPGGFYNYMTDVKNALYASFPGPNTTVINLQPNSTFAPTVSSLGINVNDYWYNIDNDENILCKTEFDAFYAPIKGNQLHMDISTEAADWLYDQIINTTWDIGSYNKSFNFAVNTNNILFQDTHIHGGANLWINKDINSDYCFQPNPLPAPIGNLNDAFVLKTPLCHPGVSITVDNNGTLELGDNLTPNLISHLLIRDGSVLEIGSTGLCKVNNLGKIIVKQGGIVKIKNQGELLLYKGYIEVENGGQLIIEGNGKLTVSDFGGVKIKNGGLLTYYKDARVHLINDNSILDISGTLELKDNASFSFSHPSSSSGYVRFSSADNPSKNIIYGNNCEINLVGNSKTDKILEVAQESIYTSDIPAVNQFKIYNGTVDLNPDVQARLNISCPLKLIGATIQRNPSFLTNTKPRGVKVFGQKGCLIANTDFNYLEAGIQGELFYMQNPLSIINCNFNECTNGLNIIGQALYVNTSRFSYNTKAI
jgi:hypothetical protein